MKYISPVLLVVCLVSYGLHIFLRGTSNEDKNGILVWVSVVCLMLILYLRSRVIDNIPVIGRPNWVALFNVVLFIYFSKFIQKIKTIGINSETLSIICLVLMLIIGAFIKFKPQKVEGRRSSA